SQRRSRTMSLREAASVVFALVALLPILLLVYLLSRHELMHSTEAQVGLLAAIGVSILGFVVFRRMMDQISALAQGFIAPTEAKPETLRRVERASAVPGLGEVTEIGQVRDAFYHMLDDLRGSTQRLEALVFQLGTLHEMVEPAARIPRIQYLLGLVLQSPRRGVRNVAKRRDGAVSDALRLPPFGSTDLQFLNALMTYIGYAVDNSRLLEEAQSSATQLQGVVDDLKSTQAQLVRGETLRAMGQ